MNGKYLTRKPESIIQELLTLPEDIDTVCFADDNTLHHIKRAWQLSSLIKEHGIKKKISMYGRADTIVKHPDLIQNFRDAGLDIITVGIESIKNDELSKLNKRITVDVNNEAIRILHKLGITVGAHFIINPDFSKDDFRQLYSYVCQMNLWQPIFATLTPLPGTELFNRSCDQIVIKDYGYFDFIHSVLPTKLSRKVYYCQLSSLYLKSYSFIRYFLSLFKDIKQSLRKPNNSETRNVGRPSFLKMILVHVVGYPLTFKLRWIYKSGNKRVCNRLYDTIRAHYGKCHRSWRPAIYALFL